jgi:C1A family cysteine protease
MSPHFEMSDNNSHHFDLVQLQLLSEKWKTDRTNLLIRTFENYHIPFIARYESEEKLIEVLADLTRQKFKYRREVNTLFYRIFQNLDVVESPSLFQQYKIEKDKILSSIKKQGKIAHLWIESTIYNLPEYLSAEQSENNSTNSNNNSTIKNPEFALQ